MTMGEKEFKYFAFISYNSKDTEWGKRLQRKLENYRMPSTLCSEHGWERRPIKPVFFAPTDIQPGGLTEEVQERLRASKNLIVICSPNSAKSQWVGKEIEFFHGLGRTKQIHFFIVDGVPHSGNPDTECFNPIVKTLGLPEILGANIHEKIYRWPWLNKERAYVQLVSKLLGVEFDAIWQRHKRQLKQKIVAWMFGIVAVIAALIGVWQYSRSVDVVMRVSETSVHNDNLPPLKDAVVTLTLENETKTDTLRQMDGSICLPNIPRRYIGKEVHMSFVCKDFLPLDTTLTLSQDVVLNIRRDAAVYGNISFRLWNPNKEEHVGNTAIEVDGRKVTSDGEGRVTLTIPIAQQKTSYTVTSSDAGISSIIVPPCGPDDVVLVE